jgi:predicted nucleic acid-binding protein
LAQEPNAELVILDERLARRRARRLGLSMTGTLGILLRAKELGLVSAIAPFVNDLRQGGIQLSDAVVTEALRLAGKT